MDDKYISDYRKEPFTRADWSRYKSWYTSSKKTKQDFDDEQDEQEKIWNDNLAKLRAAPNPKIVKIDEALDSGNNSLAFQVAVIFDTNTLSKASVNYSKFDPKNHSCKIYRWDPKMKIVPSVVSKSSRGSLLDIPTIQYDYPDGAYMPWLEHKRSKPTAWKNIAYDHKEVNHTNRIVMAHLFFKTEEDFKNWMGDHYASMFTDLLG